MRWQRQWRGIHQPRVNVDRRFLVALFDAPNLTSISNYGAVVVVAVFMVKEFFAYLRESKKTGNGSNGYGVVKLDLGPLHQKLDQLLKVDSAGQKTSEWWELTFARIFKQCLDDHENKINRPVTEEAAQMRQDILEALKSLDRKLSEAIVEMHRQNRNR